MLNLTGLSLAQVLKEIRILCQILYLLLTWTLPALVLLGSATLPSVTTSP